MKKGKIIIGLVLVIIIIGGLLAIKPVKNNLSVKNNEKGIVLYGEEKYNEALVLFQKSVKLDESFVEGFINLAKTHLALGNYPEAFTQAQKGLVIAPESAELNTICGQSSINKEEYNEALEFFNTAIASDSSLAVAYYYRGIAKANLGDLESSLADYKKAQELDANNPEYYESSVLVRTKMDDYGGIITDYNKIIALDPTNTEAFYQRGYFKLNLDDYAGAIEDFDNALKLDDKLGKAHYYKGLTNAKWNKLEDAAVSFEKAAGLDYKAHEAYFNEGLAYLQLNKVNDAKRSFNSSLKIDPNGSKATDANMNLGVVELMQANFKEATRHFTNLIDTDNSNAEAFFNRAYAYGELKKHNQAIADLDKCVSLGKKTPEVYYLRGVQYIHLSNYSGSCPDLNIAMKNGHEEAKKLYNMYCN